jgi:hypothetical protein
MRRVNGESLEQSISEAVSGVHAPRVQARIEMEEHVDGTAALLRGFLS